LATAAKAGFLNIDLLYIKNFKLETEITSIAHVEDSHQGWKRA